MSRVHEITQIFRELSRGRPGLHAGHGTGLQTQGGSHHQAGQNTHIEGHGHHREPLHTPYTHDSHWRTWSPSWTTAHTLPPWLTLKDMVITVKPSLTLNLKDTVTIVNHCTHPTPMSHIEGQSHCETIIHTELRGTWSPSWTTAHTVPPWLTLKDRVITGETITHTELEGTQSPLWTILHTPYPHNSKWRLGHHWGNHQLLTLKERVIIINPITHADGHGHYCEPPLTLAERQWHQLWAIPHTGWQQHQLWAISHWLTPTSAVKHLTLADTNINC